jgi:FixJ family two-component response regulator
MPRATHSEREYRGVVAVIEDDISLNQAIVRQLRSAGFRTCSFMCARDALAEPAPIADCLVLDVHLPDMTGFELLHHFAMPVPTVIITAHDDPMHRRAASDARVVAYLTKPFGRESLLEAVGRAVEQSR